MYLKRQITLDCKKNTSTSPNRRERPLVRKTGGVPQKERDRWTERGRQDAVLYENEDKSLIDVENVETTGEMFCHLSSRTPLNSSLCTFIAMKNISPTFISYQCI